MTADVSIQPSMVNLLAAGAVALAGGYAVVAAWRTQVPWASWRLAAMLACRLGVLAAAAAWCLELHVSYRSTSGRVEMVVLADRSASISPAGRSEIDRRLARVRQAFAARPGWWLRTIDVAADGGRASPIAESLQTALRLLPGRGEGRILLLSDGRATGGDVMDLAPGLRSRGVRLLAVPVEPLGGESLLAELNVPPAAWRNVPLPVEAVLHSAEAQPCTLTLTVDGQPGERREARVPAGVSAVELSAKLPADGVHRIEVRAEFARDRLEWNNFAAALVDVPLAPRVLIVADPPSAAAALDKALSAGGLRTHLSAPAHLPAELACDCIVLADVSAEAMTAARLAAIERFVREGGSVVFTGGPKAFAAGGYVGSALEAAFPVLLLPKKERPPYSLAVVLDNSWSMNEGLTSSVGKIDLAKEIAIAAIGGLHKGDWLSLVSFDSDYHTIIPPTQVAELRPLEYEIARIGAFGMTNILGGMQHAAGLLRQMDAPYKHMILVSDGQETETGTDYSRLLAVLGRDKVTLSTIGVGLHPNDKLLNTLAYGGKGRYAHANSVAEVPAVVLREARGLEDELIVAAPHRPRKIDEDPALTGLDVDTWPELGGYNRSRARTHAWTPLTIAGRDEPLLARMRYGRGQSLALLTAAGGPWAAAWIDNQPAQYLAFWRQAVVSVLGPPYRDLPATVSYEDGWPTFDLTVPADEGRRELTRLAGERQVTAEAAAGPIRVSGGQCDAALVTVKGKVNRAFGWRRTFGREFADARAGRRTLEELCRAADGVFDASEEAALAEGRAAVPAEIAPPTWLMLAAGLLVIELLLRRLPALTSLRRRRDQTEQEA